MATLNQEDLAGRTVDGRYTVLAHIADGGMGSVYAGLDTRLDRQVALKVMRPELARDADFVTRFRREARSAARLSHPNVVAVFDQGEDDGQLFLAMEFVDGQTLRDLIHDKGALTPREAFAVTEGVLEALSAAHRKGIVHRDIKPENVLLSADDVVKVADFGLARAMGTSTATGLTGPMLGTVAYLAPEQIEHGRSDHRSDLYGVGLLLHEMLTGSPAVVGDSPIHVAWQHVNGALTPPSQRVPSLPAEVDELVARALCTDPSERYEDAADFLTALRSTRHALSGDDLDHRPDPPAAAEDDDEARTETGVENETTGRPQRQDTSALHRPTSTLPFIPGRTPGRTGDEATTGSGGTGASTGSTAHTPKRRRSLLPILLALLLLVAAGGGAYWWFGPPGERTVPAVVGVERTVAEQTLHAEDLQPATDEEFSETVPRGRVIRAGSDPGTVVRRGTQIPLVVSKGPERYDVPDVAGKSVQDATALLQKSKLVTSSAPRKVFHDTIAEGLVVGTAPKVGTSTKPGTQVTLILSRGRQPVPIDEVAGTPLNKARAQLTEAGLTVTVAEERPYSSEIRAGSVLSTRPEQGPLYRGDAIVLVVSRGPEMIALPDVRGKTAAQAEQALEAAGFTVRINRIAGGIFGTAHSTVPAGGIAPKGSTVTLNVV